MPPEEIDAEEFDRHDLFGVEAAKPCCFCGEPSNTVSLSFEAPLHRGCVDKQWVAYWKAFDEHS